MINIIKKHWPLITALVILLITLSVLLTISVKQNQGHFVYAIGDTYIIMAITKNFVQHGVLGITRYEFTSTNSSLLWILLLSFVYFLFGVNEVSPFILSLIFGILTICLIYILLRKYKLNSILNFITLILVIFFCPIPTVVFTGLEHTMHTLVTIFFVYLSAKILSNEKNTLLTDKLLIILAPFVTMSRYEGLFLIFIVCCLFILKRRLPYALLLGGTAVFPLFIYGLISVSKGWYFLPSALLLKGTMPESTSLKVIIKFLLTSYERLFADPHVLTLVIVALILYILRFNKNKNFWENGQIMLAIFIITTLLHMQFAKTRWFYRYEAYLVALGIFIIAITLFEYLNKETRGFKIDKSLIPKYAAIIILISFFVFPLGMRSKNALLSIPRSTKDIYKIIYPQGLFLKQYYQGQVIGLTEVSTTVFLADIKCLDLSGLGTYEIIRERLKGRYNAQMIYELSKSMNMSIAMVMGGNEIPVPPQWIKVGQWKLMHAFSPLDTVDFYATTLSEAKTLIKNLRTFSVYLPKDVILTIYQNHI